ncbi:hypothetical protein ACRDNQ_07050 [Palleronia sp. KMU-117]|uniref:hypothetical protein n=1 Tax=Palleronia sp. KMU-117 TaxID=3434108 RepID=UPI003D763CB0
MMTLLLSGAAALILLAILWVRVTKRDQAKARHKKVTSHLDWRAPVRSSGRMRARPSRI